MADQVNNTQNVVPKTARFAMLVTALRQAALVIGSTITVLGFVRDRDFGSLITYFGDQFFTIIAAVGTLATLAWGQFATWRRAKTAAVIADKAPDKVAVVADLTVWDQVKLKWKGIFEWLKSLRP